MLRTLNVVLIGLLFASGCSESAAVCGEGTRLDAGECVPSSTLDCGSGTRLENGRCVPESTLACGEGTQLEGDECVPDGSVACGVGTHLEGDECVPDYSGDARYEVRVAADEITADGFAKMPVFAIGTLADGSPSEEPVLFGISRAGAGHFAEPVLALTQTGVTNYYTACNTALFEGCAGPFRVTLALANAPDTVVAVSQEIELVTPMGVGSLAACQGEGSVAFFDGDEGDWIHPWTEAVSVGTWTASVDAEVDPTYVRVHVDPDDNAQGSRWGFDFSTRELGQPMGIQVYENAQRYPFEDANRPGLNVSGDGRGCNRLCGHFEIHELEVEGSTLKRFAATFEQRCECGTSTLRGCVVYEAP